MCALLGSTKPNRPSQNCAERCGFRFADGESFLSRIVNGDETWINHFERQTKRQPVEWHNPTFFLEEEV